MESHIYPESFYDQINQGSIRSARHILTEVFDWFHPESVIDFGCGEGAWLSVARELCAKRIRGIDGHYIDVDRLLIPKEDFYTSDLADPTLLNEGKFDLVISLEVAEHLPESSADHFVEILTMFGDLVLFSAAIPGQGGENHINEQWHSYWVEKFAKHDYTPTQYFAFKFWNDPEVENWYKQNIILFIKDDLLYDNDDYYEYRHNFNWGKVIDVVHPNNWNDHYLSKR